MRDQYSGVFKMSLGMEVEGEFYGCVRKYCYNTNQLHKFKGTSGSRLDVAQGTDCLIGNMRTDFTCFFSGKDHMKKLPAKIHLDRYDLDIKFGIRTGNNHKGGTTFSKPVMVIGFDTPDNAWLHQNMEGIFEAISKITPKMLAYANKEYQKALATC